MVIQLDPERSHLKGKVPEESGDQVKIIDSAKQEDVPAFRKCCGKTIERNQKLSKKYRGLVVKCECGGEIKFKT